MPKGLLTKWLEALRSGNYKQARGSLYNQYSDGYCCLGVLEHVADGKVEMHNQPQRRPTVSLAMPSQEFCKAHGIDADWRKYECGGSGHPMAALANMNDCIHNDFNKLADFIEECVKGK